MREEEKRCYTCQYAYLEPERMNGRNYLRQKCGSSDYNSPNYTHDMLMEDWGRGYCRFWAPKIQEG